MYGIHWAGWSMGLGLGFALVGLYWTEKQHGLMEQILYWHTPDGWLITRHKDLQPSALPTVLWLLPSPNIMSRCQNNWALIYQILDSETFVLIIYNAYRIIWSILPLPPLPGPHPLLGAHSGPRPGSHHRAHRGLHPWSHLWPRPGYCPGKWDGWVEDGRNFQPGIQQHTWQEPTAMYVNSYSSFKECAKEPLSTDYGSLFSL
jgi:hypothetical protein